MPNFVHFAGWGRVAGVLLLGIPPLAIGDVHPARVRAYRGPVPADSGRSARLDGCVPGAPWLDSTSDGVGHQQRSAASRAPGAPRWVGATVVALNNAGDFAGVVVSDDGVRHPALWRRGALVDLGVPPGYTQGAAVAVNDSGVVLARVWADPPRRWALAPTTTVLWRAGRFCWPSDPPLPARGTPPLEFTALNNAGQLAGVLQDASGFTRPFVWTAGQWRSFHLPALAYFPLYQTDAVSALNDSGVFVGQVRHPEEEPPDDLDAIVRVGDHLGLVAAATFRESKAVAINNRGEILGWFRGGEHSVGGPRVAFVARSGRPLATFPPRVPPGDTGPRARRRALVPVAMNDAGAWVGAFEGGPPVVVGADGVIRRLAIPAEFAGRPVAPAAINGAGVVAGWVDLTDRADHARGTLRGRALVWRDGVPTVLPLTPTPPSTAPPDRGEIGETPARRAP